MNRAKLNRMNGQRRVVVRTPEECGAADRTTFLAEIKCWAIWKGFKPGYAAVKYKDRFGQWPPWSIKDIEPADVVGAETLKYIEKQKRLWVKERKKQREVEEQARAEAGVMPSGPDDYIELADYRP